MKIELIKKIEMLCRFRSKLFDLLLVCPLNTQIHQDLIRLINEIEDELEEL